MAALIFIVEFDLDLRIVLLNVRALREAPYDVLAFELNVRVQRAETTLLSLHLQIAEIAPAPEPRAAVGVQLDLALFQRRLLSLQGSVPVRLSYTNTIVFVLLAFLTGICLARLHLPTR